MGAAAALAGRAVTAALGDGDDAGFLSHFLLQLSNFLLTKSIFLKISLFVVLALDILFRLLDIFAKPGAAAEEVFTCKNAPIENLKLHLIYYKSAQPLPELKDPVDEIVNTESPKRRQLLQEHLDDALVQALSKREWGMLRLHCGWRVGRVRTVEEIGFKHERVGQIVEEARQKLEDYLNHVMPPPPVVRVGNS